MTPGSIWRSDASLGQLAGRRAAVAVRACTFNLNLRTRIPGQELEGERVSLLFFVVVAGRDPYLGIAEVDDSCDRPSDARAVCAELVRDARRPIADG